MSKLKVGVIIGRFQVPQVHEGHVRLFLEVAGESDRIVVLLGVSPVDGYTAENPLTFAQRSAMLQITDLAPFKGMIVLPLLDMRTNEGWSEQVDSLLRSAYPNDDITLYGGRDSFTDSYKGKLPVKKSAFYPVIGATGTQTRAAIKEANSPEFYAGQIFALQRQYPKVYPTVDIAMLRIDQDTDQTQTLLIQRVDSGHWCFPGGFVDPTDRSFDVAAKRELMEEVGLAAESPLQYIGSYRINDFRYRASRDKIITTFFAADYAFGTVTPNPGEVQDYKWVTVLTLDADRIISDVHRPLMDELREWLVEKM